MKRITVIISIMCLALSLTACNGEEHNGTEKDTIMSAEKKPVTAQSPEPTAPTVEPKTEVKEAETVEPKTEAKERETAEPKAEAKEAETSEPETLAVTKTSDGIDPNNPSVNWGTPDGPQTAAENYYVDTVFELVSLAVMEASKEHVIYTVVSKKGGVLVEPNRTIELQYKDGAWNVINEGY